MKNLTLTFWPKIFFEVNIHVEKPGKKYGTKSQCQIFQGIPIPDVYHNPTGFSEFFDILTLDFWGRNIQVGG